MKRLIILLIVAIFAMPTFAQVNGTLSYQGYLTDSQGEPVNANNPHNFLFTFYSEEDTLTRGPINADVIKGLFTVVIGSELTGNNIPLPTDIWEKSYVVGIAVDGGQELDPIPLTSVPYAFQAQIANNVDGADISGTIDAAILSGTIDNTRLDPDLQDLADGELTGSKIGTGISATNITTGTLSGALVGTGVDGTNITTGTLSGTLLDAVDASLLTGAVDNGLLDADLQDLADGELSGSKVGLGINATNITTGVLSGALLDAVDVSILTGSLQVENLDPDLEDLADGSLTGSKVGTGIIATNITTGTLDGALLNAVNTNKLSGSVAVANGGTGAATLTGALIGNGITPVTAISSTGGSEYLRSNAGNTAYEFGTLVVSGAEITDGSIGAVDLADGAVSGGTGGKIVDGTITNADISASAAIDGSKIGTNINGANITDGTITSAKINGSIAIADGGTGATTAAAARTSLGVQALDAGLTSISGLTTSANRMIYTSGADTYTTTTLSAFARTFLDDSDAGSVRTTIGAQALNTNLTDLADGSLTGTKVSPNFGSQTVVTTGQIGAGTSSPTTTLEVVHGNGAPSTGEGLSLLNNTARWTFASQSGGELYLYYGNSSLRGIFNNTTGAYTNSSDRRIKKNIIELDNILSDVRRIPIYKYHYNTQNNNEEKYIGVIAQDLLPIFPSLVQYASENDFYTVNYSSLSAIAIKAIQEQQVTIDNLKQEIKNLKVDLARSHEDKLIVDKRFQLHEEKIELLMRMISEELKPVDNLLTSDSKKD